MRRVLTATLLALTVGLPSAAPAIAQEPPNDLIAALGSVPDSLDIRQQLVSWIDYQALIASREGAADPASMAELIAQLDAKAPAARLWMAALNGAASGSGDLLPYLLGQGPEWPRTVGFDFTDIRSELAFGQPPSDGMVLHGTFDPERIGAALTARDFTRTQHGPFGLWCRSDGCDKGLEMDLKGRDPADPFGGALGRRQPLAVSEDALLSSAAIETVEGMLDATGDLVPSLGDDGTYIAVAEALGGEGTLLQATLVPTSGLLLDPPLIFGPDASIEDIKQRLAELAADFEPMPPAQLLGIGDAATETEQVVTLALAYPTLADAEVAADVLPRRLDTMLSLRTRQPWRELLTQRGVDAVDARAVERPDGEGALALLTFRAPLAGSEADDSGMVVASSMVYHLFAQMILARDTVWLTPSLPTLD